VESSIRAPEQRGPNSACKVDSRTLELANAQKPSSIIDHRLRGLRTRRDSSFEGEKSRGARLHWRLARQVHRQFCEPQAPEPLADSGCGAAAKPLVMNVRRRVANGRPNVGDRAAAPAVLLGEISVPLELSPGPALPAEPVS